MDGLQLRQSRREKHFYIRRFCSRSRRGPVLPRGLAITPARRRSRSSRPASPRRRRRQPFSRRRPARSSHRRLDIRIIAAPPRHRGRTAEAAQPRRGGLFVDWAGRGAARNRVLPDVPAIAMNAPQGRKHRGQDRQRQRCDGKRDDRRPVWRVLILSFACHIGSSAFSSIG